MEAAYAKRPSRITKEELCMILAFWMEQSPLLERPKCYEDKGSKREKLLNGVGAVLAKPNGIIFALDCSRKGVHGVARLLMRFPSQTQDSVIYSSRKPCSFCTKLLVQCRVAKVCYLPIVPERNDIADIAKVDHLFKVSQVAQSVLVPSISKSVIENAKKKKQAYSRKLPSDEEGINRSIEDMKRKYWSRNWKLSRLKKELPWLAFDTKMKDQVTDDMENMFRWVAVAALRDPSKNTEYKEYKKEPPAISETVKLTNAGPDVESREWQNLALHTSRIAKIISYKTDDPKTGVGAVILMENKEIVAVGWNGFPSKALYGDFPRASDDDGRVDDNKYSYVLHAEQNALMFRNKEDIDSDSTTMFVTRTPCSECVPLLMQAGVKNVVLPLREDKPNKKTGQLNYNLFETQLEDGLFSGFESYDKRIDSQLPVTPEKDSPSTSAGPPPPPRKRGPPQGPHADYCGKALKY